MQILYINNAGQGYAEQIEVAEGTSITRFFEEKIGVGKEDQYNIRVNRNPVPKTYMLQPGDRVTITPAKITGALVQPCRLAA